MNIGPELWINRWGRPATVALYALASSVPLFSNALLVLFYTSEFSLSEFAEYGIATAASGLIEVTLDLGVPDAMFRNSYTYREARIDYLRSMSRWISALTFLVLPVFGIVLYGICILTGVSNSRSLLLIPVVLANAWLGRLIVLLQTISIALEVPLALVVGRTVQAGVTAATGAILVGMTGMAVAGALLAITAGAGAAFLPYYHFARRGSTSDFRGVTLIMLKDCLKLGLPLVPNRLAVVGRQLAFRPLLATAAPTVQIGLFSFASTLATTLVNLTAGVNLALGPVYFRRKHDPDLAAFNSKLRAFQRVFVAGLFTLWSFAVLFCTDAIHLLAGAGYAGAAPICSVLLCATFVQTQHPFLLRQIYFVRRTWVLPAITIPCVFGSLVLAIVMVRGFGMASAAWAVVISDVTLFVALMLLVRDIEPAEYPFAAALGFTAVLSILALWTSSPAAISPGSSGLAIRAGVGLALASAAFVTCIWPHRRLMVSLAQE